MANHICQVTALAQESSKRVASAPLPDGYTQRRTRALYSR